MPDPKKARRLTDDEREQIVRLRLNAIPVRKVAADVGTSKTTVTQVFHAWLDETTVERRESLERERSRVITRLERIADDARIGANAGIRDKSLDTVDRVNVLTKYMQQERQAWAQLATVAGYNAPQRVEMSGGLTLPSDEEAARILAEIDELPPPKL